MTRNPRFEEKCKFTISDVPVFYARVTENNYDDYEGKKRYKMTLNIPEDLAKKMEDSGFNVKHDENGEYFVDTYRNINLKSGDVMPPPPIRFEDGTPYDPTKDGLIGNETVCSVECSAKYTKVGKVWRLPLCLESIVIKELVPYEAAQAQDAREIF